MTLHSNGTTQNVTQRYWTTVNAQLEEKLICQDRLCCHLMLFVIRLIKSTSEENVAYISLIVNILGKATSSLRRSIPQSHLQNRRSNPYVTYFRRKRSHLELHCRACMWLAFFVRISLKRLCWLYEGSLKVESVGSFKFLSIIAVF
jgi:hypothetical protein